MTTLQSREDALLRRVRAFDWARLKWCFAATALVCCWRTALHGLTCSPAMTARFWFLMPMLLCCSWGAGSNCCIFGLCVAESMRHG